MNQEQVVDGSHYLFWAAVPSICILTAYYFGNKIYARYRLKKHGIGKGAPGFQTNVKKLQVTPEIAERLRRGEYVSSEEIEAAVARADTEAKKRPPQGVIEVGFGPREETPQADSEKPANEWLPDNLTNPKKRGKGKRK
ncbi:hypothetical protein AGABI1DRAFT_116360 [Agaricus bisporus var. burnettii JB137-S8]|uniref:Uncharacterized protein n=2 Tax=Agaricus bisporus var. burnettii TaxID=192524 RepID=K5XLW2_AGABU|nr:uncharacterized protein AGABI1DRAFT_116360 [Agaricus bisporus var. burnettii JB137-S8]EKM75530.1 hypothetical protein AGABI1DRAFT_116360 [Agaricus bisporus var. burnettii JB137-S8]KAF7768444.1 hypothetical protein Agabi119p4_7687 [Agaricus bisporus var. burnettii]